MFVAFLLLFFVVFCFALVYIMMVLNCFVFHLKESKKFSTNILTKFSIDFDGLWYTAETCWCDEPHTHFIWSIQYSRDKPYLYDFFFFFFFCAFPSYICGVHHFLGEIFAYVTVF